MTKAKAKQPAKKVLERMSISALAMEFDLDRITVRKRLAEANIKPTVERAREKLFDITPELVEALEVSTGLLDAAKLRKETAAARKLELQVAEAEGDLVRVSEFTEAVQKLFTNVYQEVAVRLPKRVATRLVKAATPSDCTAILKAEMERVFASIRDNHEKYLK